jgi:transposase
MFRLANLRETRVWQEAHEEGKADAERKLIERWLGEGKSHKEIAGLLGVSLSEVRRLAKSFAGGQLHRAESE